MSDLDIRLKIGFLDHPKTEALEEELGPSAILSLVRLFFFCRRTAGREQGDLSGLSDRSIERAAKWRGEQGRFIGLLLEPETKFVDGSVLERRIHDWHDHQEWACGAIDRSEKSRAAALSRWHDRHTEPVDDCPKCAAGMPPACDPHATRNAPSPSSPSPSSPSPPGDKEDAPAEDERPPEPPADAGSSPPAQDKGKPKRKRETARARAERRAADFARWIREPFEGYPRAWDYWRATFPALDGQNGRPSLGNWLEALKEWYCAAPASKERKTGPRWITSRLQADYQRYRPSYDLDVKHNRVARRDDRPVDLPADPKQRAALAEFRERLRRGGDADEPGEEEHEGDGRVSLQEVLGAG